MFKRLIPVMILTPELVYLVSRSPAIPVKSHVSALASTNSQRITAKTAGEELAIICACTGPVETGLGAVYVECGEQSWPKKMLTHGKTISRRPTLVCDPI